MTKNVRVGTADHRIDTYAEARIDAVDGALTVTTSDGASVTYAEGEWRGMAVGEVDVWGFYE